MRYTLGYQDDNQLIEHFKKIVGYLDKSFHTLKVDKVNKNSVNLKCVQCDYCARHKFKVDQRFLIVDSTILQSGKTRNKFTLDRSNPKIRNVEYWTSF